MFGFRSLLRPAACALALAVALTACGGAFQRPAVDVHGATIDDATVKATIPEAKVLTSLLRQQCGTQVPGESSHSPCVRYTVGFLIQQQIVRAYAQAHHIAVRPYEVGRTLTAIKQRLGPDQVRQLLGQYGVSGSEFDGLIREQLLVGKVQQAVADAAVSEQRLRAQYQRERSRFTLLHAAHILVNSKQEADRISERVTPQNFADLAKLFSIDKGSAAKGGDLGTIPVGQLDADFVRGALALQPGEISKPIHTQFGWHIIRLISVKTAPYASVRSQLQQELAGPAVQKWFLDQVTGVTVNPRYGRLDPSTGQVVPLDSTSTALPTPELHRAVNAPEGVPEGPVPSSQGGERLLDLVRVMARLRGPGGCPWDAEQDHRSLARHLLEEAHEVLDAIDRSDDERLRDELGDLLLQVVFHAQMAADEGRWDVDDVADGIVRKLIRRHPHVFGDVTVSGADEVLVNWERIKAEEKGASGEAPGVEDDIPPTLPALARASKVLRRAAGWGFEWRTTEAAMAALRDEVDELEQATDDVEGEVGDVLFATVAVARRMGVDPETALRRTINGFADRYERFMALARAEGLDIDAMSEDELRRRFREARG